MKKILIIALGFFLPFSALAATDSYSRLPSATTTTEGTTTFAWSTSGLPVGTSVEQLEADKQAGGNVKGECLNVVGDPQSQIQDVFLPAADYTLVKVLYGATDCTSLLLGEDSLEGDGGSVIFSKDPATTTEATTTPSVDHYKDYLFISGVVIFLLAYPVWGRMLGKPTGI